jgi:hypothetical protein
MDRNPRYRNAGKFLKLSDFPGFTKDKDLSGIMISIEVRSLCFKTGLLTHELIYAFASAFYMVI